MLTSMQEIKKKCSLELLSRLVLIYEKINIFANKEKNMGEFKKK